MYLFNNAKKKIKLNDCFWQKKKKWLTITKENTKKKKDFTEKGQSSFHVERKTAVLLTH